MQAPTHPPTHIQTEMQLQCPDTFAPSYSSNATSEAGLVAASAEERKEAKYSNLGALHCFTPVAIETSGVFGPKSLLFVCELGRRIARVTGEVNSWTSSASCVRAGGSLEPGQR